MSSNVVSIAKSVLNIRAVNRYPDGLTKLFKEIKDKEKIADLSLEYQKFVEWLRIESVPSSGRNGSL